jgi:peroxiredoxin
MVERRNRASALAEARVLVVQLAGLSCAAGRCVWVEKNRFGRKSMGIKRSTFVIDEEGRVAKALYGVKPEGHADRVLGALAP